MSERRLTVEQFNRIEGRMTLAEVEAILGSPGKRKRPAVFRGRLSRFKGFEERYWTEGDVAIRVAFDRTTGKAQCWERIGPEPPPWPGGGPGVTW